MAMPKQNKKERCESPGNDEKDSEGNQSQENIRVGLRLRPMNKLEISRRSQSCIQINESDSAVISIDSPLDGMLEYKYDQVRIT